MAYAIAALGSAGMAHGILWNASAAGWLAGTYPSYRHQTASDVTLWAAIVGTMLFVVLVGESVWSPRMGGDDWFLSIARSIAAAPAMRIIIWVFAAQAAATAAIESAEQIAFFGHVLGIGALFGAPIVAALAVQAVCAVLVSVLTLRIARALVRVRPSLDDFVAPFLRRSVMPDAGLAASASHHALEAGRAPALRPLALKTANRPPPHLIAA